MQHWDGTDSHLADEVRRHSQECLDAYASQANRVESDAAQELSTSEGGYGRRQIHELVQNGADAMLGQGGRIRVELAGRTLYVANEGRPVSDAGVEAMLSSHLSRKRDDEIGRFGLGFKSVASISDRPRVYSRSVSFAFDRGRARERIKAVVPGAPRFPMLRLAEPVDAETDAGSDSVLAQLMTWATTVVVIPLRPDVTHIEAAMMAFPAEFLLFCPHVTQLQLAAVGGERLLSLTRENGDWLRLSENGKSDLWRVFEKDHVPGRAAKDDAGELTARERIVLKWAVPRGRAVGRFWSFFPTNASTTLSGIVNAPFKLSDDRESLLEGAWNRELLTEVLPGLVAASLPHLVDAKAPAAFLDVLPARGKEARSWGDDVINQPVFDALARTRSLPDAAGVLKRPDELRLHPDDLPPAAKDAWLKQSVATRSWVHHDVDASPERRSKAERLIVLGNAVVTGSAKVSEWLEALAVGGGVEGSAAAIATAAALTEADREMASEVASAKILLSEDRRLVAPRAGTVFVRSSADEVGYQFVLPSLMHIRGVVEALQVLGVRVLDRSGEMRALLANHGAVDWPRLWVLSRNLPVEVAEGIIREGVQGDPLLEVHARSAKGPWQSIGRMFLAGPVIPADGRRDAEHLVDPAFHEKDRGLLEALGAVDHPRLRRGAPEEPWVGAYRDLLIEQFVSKQTGHRPSVSGVVVVGEKPPYPMAMLQHLSDPGRAALTGAVLAVDDGGSWNASHRSNRSYGQINAFSATTWWLKKHGALRTSVGVWPVGSCLSADSDADENVFPVADVSAGSARRLGLVTKLADFSQGSWRRLVKEAEAWEDPDRRFTLYAWAVHFLQGTPTSIRARAGSRNVDSAPGETAVTSNKSDYRSLLDQQFPVLFMEDPDDRDALMSRWNLLDGADLLQEELVIEPIGEPERLVDRFPKLKLWLDSGQMLLELQPCRAIQLVTATPRGQVSRAVPGHLKDGSVHVTATSLDQMLQQISNALNLDLTSGDIRSIIDELAAARTRERVLSVRRAESVPDKLVLAAGGDALRGAVPVTAVEAVERRACRPVTDREAAELALAVHGVSLLQHLTKVLDQRGLEPPTQWAGRSAARRFVAGLGFPAEYAGSSVDKRPAELEVEGPVALGPLHPYQQIVTSRIRQMLDGSGSSRGMVSLPTGAGKTRVAVQALVEHLEARGPEGPLVWIAQSDELCEQAVQTWSYVWRALGPGRRLVISRFWGPNTLTEEPDDFQLVVATPEKLSYAVDNAALDWLTQAAVVVVDEAHSSVAPTYTRVLEWLGRASRGAARSERRPLIGLTATPFRNTNEQETQRLAMRYDGHRLDQGAFMDDPYAQLQSQGVLATVRQVVLEGGAVQLTDKDRESVDTFGVLPRSVESRLGDDHERNERILDSVAALPDDWTVLLFATSVENARSLAAQLTFRGVPAAAISADTDTATRRHHIERFKSGQLRVITNYNVLAQGFDAPAVRAVYVTRPTFSTNLYQQMIGRGLRGPLNGGSSEVTIVNVRDNFQQYGDKLAFYDFEHLWEKRDV